MPDAQSPPPVVEEPSLRWQDIKTVGKARKSCKFVDAKGDTLFDGKSFYTAGQFKDNFCIVSQMIDGKELRGVINTKGETVVPIEHEEFLQYMGEGYFSIFKVKKGFIDSTGKEVIPMEYKKSKRVVNGMVKACDSRYKWGILKMNGEEVAPFVYDDIGPWGDGYSRVKKGKKVGYINMEGEVAIPLDYQSGTHFSKGVAMVEKGGKFGLIDKENQVVADFQYDEIKYIVDVEESPYELGGYAERNKRFMMEEGYVILKKGKKWGYINEKGEEVVPFDFTYVGVPSRGSNRIVVRDGDRQGAFNIDTQELTWNDSNK